MLIDATLTHANAHRRWSDRGGEATSAEQLLVLL